MLFGILQSFVHFPIFIYHILSGLNIQTNPMQSTFDDVVWQEGTSKWFKVENNWNVLFLFFFASFILLFFILRIFVFSSFNVCFRHLLWVVDLTRLSPIPVTQGFVFHGPLITVGEFSEWTDLINCFWNQFVKKVENMHEFYSYLPLWNSSFDVVVGLDFSIQAKLFFSGYVFNRVGVADQNQEKKYIVTRSQKKSYQTKISKSN